MPVTSIRGAQPGDILVVRIAAIGNDVDVLGRPGGTGQAERVAATAVVGLIAGNSRLLEGAGWLQLDDV